MDNVVDRILACRVAKSVLIPAVSIQRNTIMVSKRTYKESKRVVGTRVNSQVNLADVVICSWRSLCPTNGRCILRVADGELIVIVCEST